MLPTLNGRIQTRLFMLATWGVLWTLVLTPVLPDDPGYRVTFVLLAVVAVLGVLWELVYHVIMQWRWEKDWPTFFGFITFVNEGLLIIILLKANLVPALGDGVEGEDVSIAAFLIDFIIIWMTIWVWTNGPMRIFNVHWRFFGGRIV